MQGQNQIAEELDRAAAAITAESVRVWSPSERQGMQRAADFLSARAAQLRSNQAPPDQEDTLP